MERTDVGCRVRGWWWTLALALSIAGCGPREPIVIGYLGGLTGRVTDLGVAGRDAAILAIEQRNAAGGVNGRPVTLVARDDRQDADAATAALKELIDLKVAAVVGPMTSSMAVAVAPVADASRVLLISPTVTANAMTGKDDYFIRVIAPTRVYAAQHARHVRDTLRLARLVAIYDIGNRAYTQSWLGDFTDEFERRGGRVVLKLPYESSPQTSFSRIAGLALESGADGVLILASSLDTAMLCQQVRKSGSQIPIVSSEWGATERLIELGGTAVEGISAAQFVDRDATEPAYVAFRSAYIKRFSMEPGFAGVATFDAMQVLLDALTSGDVPGTLKERIIAKGRYAGLQGDVFIDRYGDGSRMTTLTTVRQGRFVSQPR